MDQRRQRSLHVHRAASIEAAAGQLAPRVERPRRRIGHADRVHVRVEQHARAGTHVERPDHVPERIDLDRVAKPLELRRTSSAIAPSARDGLDVLTSLSAKASSASRSSATAATY
jgi:hypothetical protein